MLIREYIDFGIVLLTFALGLILLSGVILQAVCLIWAPVAGAICFRIARDKGLPTADYAVFGAVYALLLLVPWLHLIRRMNNRGFSKGEYDTAYFCVYAFWLSIIICHCLYIVLFVAGDSSVLLLAYLFAPVPVGAFALTKSVKSLLRRHSNGELYGRLYISPFAGASATFAVAICTWLFLYVYMSSFS